VDLMVFRDKFEFHDIGAKVCQKKRYSTSDGIGA